MGGNSDHGIDDGRAPLLDSSGGGKVDDVLEIGDQTEHTGWPKKKLGPVDGHGCGDLVGVRKRFLILPSIQIFRTKLRRHLAVTTCLICTAVLLLLATQCPGRTQSEPPPA